MKIKFVDKIVKRSVPTCTVLLLQKLYEYFGLVRTLHVAVWGLAAAERRNPPQLFGMPPLVVKPPLL